MNTYERYGDYAQRRDEREGSGAGAGTLITFLLLGAGIGAALACLFTPRRGDELRGAISRGYRKTVDGVSQRTRELRDRGSNLVGFERGEAEKQYGQG